MSNNYDVNYDDERFAQVETDKENALTELEDTYSGMIEDVDDYYNQQIEASKEWADKQSQLQQEQTDFAIEQIEQQKDQQHKDYIKEQSGAYVDWQKQSNQYGAEAERQANAGMNGTGFSESSQVSMYNTYQNRVATARDVYNRAVLNYDNAIKDARIQNNAALAEIAYQSLQTQLELSLEGFQYKNTLILEQANKKTELNNTYYQRYLDVLNQINTENAMAEEIRQFNENYALQLKQYDESVRQFNQDYDLKVQQYHESIRQFELEIERLRKKDDEEAKQKAAQLELEKKQLEQQQKQWEEEMKHKKAQLAEEQRQFDRQMAQKYNSTIGNTGNNLPIKEETPETQAVTFNVKSVIDAGYAGRSSAEIERLIEQGYLTVQRKGNQLYVYKTSTPKSNSNSFINSRDILTRFGSGPRSTGGSGW